MASGLGITEGRSLLWIANLVLVMAGLGGLVGYTAAMVARKAWGKKVKISAWVQHGTGMGAWLMVVVLVTDWVGRLLF